MTGRSYSKRDVENLQTILKYCEDIEYFVQLYGSDETDFYDCLPLQYGCAFSLMQIGEHIKRLSSDVKTDHPEIDWQRAAGMRDYIAHDYANVDIPRVRSTVLTKIPSLKEVCLFIINSLP